MILLFHMVSTEVSCFQPMDGLVWSGLGTLPKWLSHTTGDLGLADIWKLSKDVWLGLESPPLWSLHAAT